MAGTGRLFAFQTNNWWSQLKTAGSAIYANRHYLALYRTRCLERLAQNEVKCSIIGDVHIHPTATVDPTATVCLFIFINLYFNRIKHILNSFTYLQLGPNVSVGAGAVIGPGVRIRESLVLSDASIADHSLVLHSIVGRRSAIGQWARVEGTPCDPNPNKPFAKMDNPALFNADGRLNPSITILGMFCCHLIK